MVDPFEVASPEELAHALREERDLERRIQAACAIGDRLRDGGIAFTPELQAALHETMQNERGWTDLRFETAIALCEAHDIAGEAITTTLNTRSRRFDAVKALAALNTPRVREQLRLLAKKWFLSWQDRLVVAAALSVIGDEVSGAFFHERLIARRPFERRALALHLLGDLRHPLAYSTLTAIADTADDPARGTAIRALGHLNDKRSADHLRSLGVPEDMRDDVDYALALLAPST